MVTDSTVQALAASQSGSLFAAADSAIIVEPDSIAIALGANHALRTEQPLLIATTGSSAAGLMSRLSTWGVEEVQLLSTAEDYFTSSFVTDLETASIDVNYLQSDDQFELSLLTSYEAAPSEYVLAETSDPVSIQLAIAHASNIGIPLLLFDSTTPDGLLASFFDDALSDESTLYFFTADEALVPSDLVPEELANFIQVVPTKEPERAFLWLAGVAQAAGVTSNEVVAAPSDSLAALALAGYRANHQRSLLVPAGATSSITTDSRATEYLALWGPETTDLDLVGVGLSNGHLTALATPTQAVSDPPPTFRVTALTRASASYTLTVTPVSGATSYKAYTPDLTLLGTSSTPTVTLAAEPNAVLVVAESGTGELARLDVRVNDYQRDDQRASVVVGSAADGANHLVFLSDLNVPRLITRTTIDPFDVPLDVEPVPVRITCADTFTETGMDATKQYTYTVTELTNVDAHACDSLLPPAPATDGYSVYSAVPLPPTEFPWEFRGARPTSPSPTTMDMRYKGIESGGADAEMEARLTRIMSPSAIGDDWEPLIVQWVAYIPDDKVLYPFPSGDPLLPALWLSGDDHGTFQPNASARFMQRLQFNWGSSHGISYTESMGESHLLKCDPSAVLCHVISSGRAPLSALNWSSLGTTNTSGAAHVWAEATVPVVLVAPAIDTDWVINLSPSKSTISGYHDNMPQHEIYIGFPYSHFDRIYKSVYFGWWQAPCLAVPHNVPLTKCSTWFNIQIG
ncbi:MAG: hypothetical protein QM598_08735 [Protaetiibacter sp.]